MSVTWPCVFSSSQQLMALPLARPPSRLSLKLPAKATGAAIRPSPPNCGPIVKEFPPNAVRRKTDRLWRGGFSLGIDLGLSRTGLALSKGYSVRPLTVLQLRGQKLELRLLEIAEEEEADEFIIGLPRSCDGRETTQSNKVRSVAGRLAVRAAERGWRVYLQDEHSTSTDATNRMINMGLSKTARQRRSDAYAAMDIEFLKLLVLLGQSPVGEMILERYFSLSGEAAELVLPKDSDLQDRLRRGPTRDIDFFSE